MVHFKAMATLVIHIRNHKKKLRTKMYIIHLYIYFYTEVKRVIIKNQYNRIFSIQVKNELCFRHFNLLM